MRYYDAHYFNSQRLELFNKVEYVGFTFLGSEEEIKEAKKFYKENVEKLDEDVIVSRAEMEQVWIEWLS